MSATFDSKQFDPATLLWYESPDEVWEEALPVGNGRLGAIVFWEVWSGAGGLICPLFQLQLW